MSGFVDLHTHVLPGLDDGAGDLDATIGMLRRAWASGTRTVVATPHMFCPRFSHRDPGRLEAAFADCIERLGACAEKEEHAFLSEMSLTLGAENYLSPELMEAVEADRVVGLNRSRYLLVEFPPYLSVDIIEPALERLVDAGFVPVLAHVERYRRWCRRRDRVSGMIDRGCLVQVNGGSILGLQGPEVADSAHQLLSSGAAHVVASDAHDLRLRRPDLDGVSELISQRLSAAAARDWLIENPAAILDGQPVETTAAPEPSPPLRPGFSLKGLWSR